MPRLGPNGEIKCWYGSLEDIHEKKCADAEARKPEAAIRALLRAVPVEIMREELAAQADIQPDNDFQHVAQDQNQKDQIQSVATLAAKIEDHVFQDSPIKLVAAASGSAAPTKKKKVPSRPSRGPLTA